MQSMHRQFGKLMKRSADNSEVSVLLKDFDNADQLLHKIIESSKAWRDAWTSVLTYQSRLVQEFEGLYCPIIGSSEPTEREPAVTPEATLARTQRLKEEYEQLKTELLGELSLVDERMITPAMQAKNFLQPLKKTIKKRDDRKLDFEHYQTRVDSGRKKTKRSDRDNAALAKAESDLNKAIEEYHSADDHLRAHLPGLIATTFSILPLLLNAQIEIQNTLLGLYYTTLHNYCEEQQLPSPPPPMEVIIQSFEEDFLPVQQELESIGCVTQARRSRPPPRTSDDSRNGSFPNGAGTRRVSNQSIGRKPSVSPVRNLRAPSPGTRSNGSHGSQPPAPSPSTLSPSTLPPTPGQLYIPSTTSDACEYSSYHQSAYAKSLPRPDQRQPSPSSTSRASSATSSNVAAMAAAAAKKKPPPPPPRSGSSSQGHFVTALYDFGGEGQGDLAFQEGDRIRVLKRTESTDDWWEGELRGVKGSFPANYCN